MIEAEMKAIIKANQPFERVVVTPSAQAVVVEYVFGAALDRLSHISHDRLWKEFRLAVPSTFTAWCSKTQGPLFSG
jgi:hypothetical protein